MDVKIIDNFMDSLKLWEGCLGASYINQKYVLNEIKYCKDKLLKLTGNERGFLGLFEYEVKPK